MKVYLKYPDEFESLISDLLTVATENVNNPDVRDRAFIYWRMLSTDPEKTKTVVFGYRPQAKDNDKLVDQSFLSDMMKSMGYASSLFEKRPEELFQRSLAEQRVKTLLFRESRSKSKMNLLLLNQLHPKTLHLLNSSNNKQSQLLLLHQLSMFLLRSLLLQNQKRTTCLICCDVLIVENLINKIIEMQ